jgi:hypothetical protein
MIAIYKVIWYMPKAMPHNNPIPTGRADQLLHQLLWKQLYR